MSGAYVAAHAEAERKKKEEEEEMTRYDGKELEDDWEFKIVRSVTGEFKKPGVVERLREEESLAGWKLVEKFDNNRIRFKRPASARKRDATLPPYVDPYRTQYGMTEAGLVLRILLVIGGIVGLIIFLVTFFIL
ncbi:MAG: hypothetical protein AB1345_00505 [Chloroflexota bacterium]